MNKTKKAKLLKFKYQNGSTSTGKPKYSYNKIANVGSDVSDEVIFGLIDVIAKVQAVSSSDVEVYETVVLN